MFQSPSSTRTATTATQAITTSPETNAAIDSTRTRKPKAFVSGLVRDGMSMTIQVQMLLMELNCLEGYGIHIVVGNNANSTRELLQQYQPNTRKKCGPLEVVPQPSLPHIKNRVDRLALLRDWQRDVLRQDYYYKQQMDIVVVTDLDMVELPSRSILVNEISHLQQQGGGVDAVCSMGQQYNPYGYYDTFATILQDGTFVYPLKSRLVKKVKANENKHKIRTNDVHGAWTQWDMLNAMQHETLNSGIDANNNNNKVRSCFGGLTIYKAHAYFQPKCRYTFRNVKHLAQLAPFCNRKDQRPCEHVVLHTCLQLAMEISPHLKTRRDIRKPHSKFMESGGQISRGIKPNNGLLRYRNQPPELAYQLQNEDIVCQINQDGELVIFNTTNNGSVIWRANDNAAPPSPDWEAMFLLLQSNGLLILVEQVKTTKHRRRLCDPALSKGTVCRRAIWSSGISGKHNHAHVLVLGGNGALSVLDATSQTALWSTGPSFDLSEMKNTNGKNNNHHHHHDHAPECLSSGTDKDINDLLQWTGTHVVLCPNSQFVLANPIKYRHDGQQVYTQGFPTLDKRAVFNVVSGNNNNNVVAVDMGRHAHVKLASVVIQGTTQHHKSAIKHGASKQEIINVPY